MPLLLHQIPMRENTYMKISPRIYTSICITFGLDLLITSIINNINYIDWRR
jgi:hypothetical protein